VTAALSSLATGGYHFRCVAQNSAGTTYGIDQIIPSNNANLASLTLSTGALSPSFAETTTGYTASVPNETFSMTITPTRAQADATVKVNGIAVASGSPCGAIPLAVGITTITTVVTAQDGTTTTTYTINVTREFTAFETWQIASFGSIGNPNAGAGEDPDRDGISNLLEFLLKGIPTGPNSSDTSILPKGVLTDTDFVFTFQQSRTAAKDLSTLIESSSTFAASDWTPVAVEHIKIEDIGNLTDRITATIPRVPGTGGFFVRLKVESGD
jgi:hypothetical protein